MDNLMKGYGWKPFWVDGEDPAYMHRRMFEVLDEVTAEIKNIKAVAAHNEQFERPIWPMVILKSPKGWTGPKEVDGQKWKAVSGHTRCRFQTRHTTRNTWPNWKNG